MLLVLKLELVLEPMLKMLGLRLVKLKFGNCWYYRFQHRSVDLRSRGTLWRPSGVQLHLHEHLDDGDAEGA